MGLLAVDVDENNFKSSKEFKEWFSQYCIWCWGHGYGDCDVCKKKKNHLLYLIKMREFKEERK